MRTKIQSALIVVAFVTQMAGPGGAGAAVVYGPIYDSYSNANLFITSRETWVQAESDAVSIGGHLVTVHSTAENQFLVTNVLLDYSGSGGPDISAVPVWLGYYDPTGAAVDDGPGGTGSQHAANFVWVDGSNSPYTNWNVNPPYPNEPNDSPPGEYYAEINWHYAAGIGPQGTWNDDPVTGSIGALNPYNPASYGPDFGIAAVPIPEPSSIALAVFGLVGFILLARSLRRG